MFKCMPFLACNRQVDSMDKRQCNLDHIPEEVARYARSLEELLLDSNHIKELNKPLFRLTKLRRLLLSDNEIFKIPPEIAQLSALVELDLSKNDISDIPDKIQFCTNLRCLNLGSNPITRLPAAMSQLRSLTTLGLSDVSLTQLPPDIGNLCNLRELELRENLLRSLPQSIAFLAQLQRLDLGANELSELPPEMGHLTALLELYVDTNDLEWLPREIGNLKQLQVLDVSENKLEALPDEIGELVALNDLTLSQNSLETLPPSIGKLKRLQILKVDKNRLIALTPAVGSCTSLQELILTENLVPELPSSLGNLGALAHLNADKNKLTELPSTIGACGALGVLSLRDNSLAALPMEIGKLEKLRVLDVSGNRLPHLPFTIGVLGDLQALWLSENQSQPLLKLQTDADARGVKILTCYLLPQRDAAGNALQPPPGEKSRQTPEREGGPGVRWVDQPEVDEEDKARMGNFQRHDTPHPKPGVPRQASAKAMEGHVIASAGGHGAKDAVLDLGERRRSREIAQPPELPPKRETGPPAVPPRRSASKEAISAEEGGPVPFPRAIDRGGPSDGRSVGFASEAEEKESRLKRKNTPHHLKHAKIAPDAASAAQSVQRFLAEGLNGAPTRNGEGTALIHQLVSAFEEQTRTIHRHQGGLGLSIAGGADSPPFNPDKPEEEGIFISKVTEGGPADQAGLKKGDQLLAVNGNGTVGVSHQLAVEFMKKAGDAVVMRVGRDVLKPKAAAPLLKPPNPASLDVSLSRSLSPDASLNGGPEAEVISTSIRQDSVSGPGFSIAGGRGAAAAFRKGDEGIFISFVTPGGSADRDAKLRVGDRVLSINGTNMKGARHDQAVALLTTYENEVHLVVARPTRVSSPLPINNNVVLTPLSLDGPAGLAVEPPLAHSSPLNTLTNKGPLVTEVVRLSKGSGSLGLTIVGGSDHSSQPFGASEPGVFVSKIVPGSVAAASGKLRIGDRLLAVNEKDVTRAPHQDVVKALQAPKKEVVLKIRHDPQPPGLQEVRIVKAGGEPLGINICGGIRSPPANPLDRTDEGIFVEEVHRSGAAAREGSLRPGTRLLEVNETSLLGCTQDEAAKALKKAGSSLRLLICDGFDASVRSQLSPPQTQDSSASPNTSFSSTSKDGVSEDDIPTELKSNLSASLPSTDGLGLMDPPSRGDASTAHASSAHSKASGASTTPSSLSSAAVSPPPPISPKPALPPKAAVAAPPPVAPKPRAPPREMSRSSDNSAEDALAGSRRPAAAPRAPAPPPTPPGGEKLSFGSKLRHFQSEIETRTPGPVLPPTANSASKIPKAQPPPPPPKKIHLVSGVDIVRMKAEEEAKIAAAYPPDRPAVVRTKKAENRRLLGQGEEPGPDAAASPAELRAAEAAKRAEWRAARLKSLESDALKAEQVLQKIIRPVGEPIEELPEDFPPPPPPLLGGSSSLSRSTTEEVDPTTGASVRRTVTTLTSASTETYSTRTLGSEIDFIDDGSSTKSDAR